MPIHDWTRVEEGVFHDFHGAWIFELRRVLNPGLLPPEYYALGEQIADGIGPDVLTLQPPRGNGNSFSGELQGAVAVAVEPPRVRHSVSTEADEYTLRQRTLVIRHRSNHRIVALVEILSPGNKSTRHAIRALVDKVLAALVHGIHLLLIDLHPLGPRHPCGMYPLLWG